MGVSSPGRDFLTVTSIDIGNVKLAVEDRGEGPVLLLVHGFPLDHTMWDEQISALSDTARVIGPDLRGFGGSDVTAGTATMDQFADDLAALLDVLAIREPITLCGLSMGGYVAFAFWQRHAHRLAKLILCDTRAEADSDEVRQNRLAVAEQVIQSGTSVLVGAMLPRLLAESTGERAPEVAGRIAQMIRRMSPDGIAAAQRGMAAREDATPILGQIAVPTLVVCGRHDTISPPAEMQAMAQTLPHAAYCEIPDAGHMSPMENPAAVNAAIRDFLGGGPSS
jgi:3-oxoadipate enol-lactonase